VPIFPTHSLYTIGTSASSSQRAGDGIGGRPAYGRIRIKYLKRSGAHCTSPCDALIGWQGLKSTSRLKKRKSQILRPRGLPHDLRESNGPGAHECHVAEREWLGPLGRSLSLLRFDSSGHGAPNPNRAAHLDRESRAQDFVNVLPCLCLWCYVFVVPFHPSSWKWCTDLERSILCCVFFRGGSETVCVCVCVYTKLSSNLRL
jgi:hypothetical protein